MTPDGRPSFDEIYMAVAHLFARRSTCARAQVGSIVTSWDGQRVLAVGYNGNYKGGPNRCDSATPGGCGCIHSEANCLLKLDFNAGTKKRMYVTWLPCRFCAKLIVNAGVSEVVWDAPYRDSSGLDIFRDAHVQSRRFPVPPGLAPVLKDGPDGAV